MSHMFHINWKGPFLITLRDSILLSTTMNGTLLYIGELLVNLLFPSITMENFVTLILLGFVY